MKTIREASSGVKAKSKGIFEARLIDEGQGSSGYYTKELLQKYGPTTFSEGRLCFANHSSEADWENGRDLNKIMARLVTDAEYREDADGKGALFANVKVRPEWIDFVEEYKDSIGMSISVSGEASEQEIDGESRLVVESFDDTDPYRSVDFVVAAGRGGKVERMLESARKIEEKTHNSKSQELQDIVRKEYPNEYAWVEDFDDDKGIAYVNMEAGLFAIEYSTEEHGKIVIGNKNEVRRETVYVPQNVQETLGSPNTKENDMDLETLAAKIDGLVEAFEASRPAETEPGEVDRAAVVESAMEAGLSKSARGRVLKAVEAGETPDDAIASEKAQKEEYEAEFKEKAAAEKSADTETGTGRIVEGAEKRTLSELKF